MSKTLTQMLDSGPKHFWGPDEDERKCVEEAKKILVSQEGTETYRKELLEALLYFTRREGVNDGYSDASNNQD